MSDSLAYKKDGQSFASMPHHFVKVPFKEAISLVGRRAVFIHAGIAYVPIVELR
jgi:DNA primase large subunit